MLVASLFTVAAPLVASQVATGHSSAGAVKSPTADTVYVAGPEPGLAISVRGSRKFEPDETQLIAAVAPPVIDPAALAAGLPEGCSTSGQQPTTGVPITPKQLVCKVPPKPHFVQYRSFIPEDNLVTTVPCWRGQALASPIPPTLTSLPWGLILVMGDASSFSTHYRIKQYADLITSTTGPATETGVVPVPSVSYNFQYPSVRPKITAADFNPGQLLRCNHEQNTASASMANEHGSTSSSAANQASVNFNGSATDPLFINPVAPIRYNLTVAINTLTNTATITGSHTCFPSHEIVIGTQVVYKKDPIHVDFATLSACLILGSLTSTQVNCTVKLDGISRCP